MEQEYTANSSNSPSLFKGAIEPGLITSAAIIIYTMIIYVAGFHTVQWLGYIGSLIILATQIHFGTKFRKKELDNNMSFGQAFKFGFSLAVIVGLVTAIFNYFYFEFIAPDIIDLAIEKSYNDMIEGGLSEEQATVQMGYAMPWMNSVSFTIVGVVFSIIFGAISALIAAAFVKRESHSI